MGNIYTRSLTKEESKDVSNIMDFTMPIYLEEKPFVAIAALVYTIAVLMCNRDTTETVTQALDEWRITSAAVENLIRENFGSIRYPDKTKTS
jgi:hypothetical protein